MKNRPEFNAFNFIKGGRGRIISRESANLREGMLVVIAMEYGGPLDKGS